MSEERTRGIMGEALAETVSKETLARVMEGIWNDEDQAADDLLQGIPDHGTIRRETLEKVVRIAFRGGVVMACRRIKEGTP